MQIEKQSGNTNESVDERIERAIEEMLLVVIKGEVHRMDPRLPRNTATFRIAVVLLVAATLGLTDVDQLAAFTNYSRPHLLQRFQMKCWRLASGRTTVFALNSFSKGKQFLSAFGQLVWGRQDTFLNPRMQFGQ